MKSTFDDLSLQCSKKTTNSYSTSFSLAVKMLANSIQADIHNIYGFVRFADEIVDSFHGYDKEFLINKFEDDFYISLEHGISLNPILNAFQSTIKKYDIDLKLVDSFIKSMKMDLKKHDYNTTEEYNTYIHGSAEVVGLMCLKVFVNGNQEEYDRLKDSAKRLGSAFQKVNFLRDLKDDIEILNRSYFPNIDLNNLNKVGKEKIIQEIEEDFKEAFKGILQLPKSARFGVYTAFIYYKQLLLKLKRTPSEKIMESRIRVENHIKLGLLAKSYVNHKFNLI